MDKEQLQKLMETNEPVGKAVIRASSLLTHGSLLFNTTEQHIYWMIENFNDLQDEWSKAVSGDNHAFMLTLGTRLGYTPNEERDGFTEWDNDEELSRDYYPSFLRRVRDRFRDHCKNCGADLEEVDDTLKCPNGCHPQYRFIILEEDKE